jgi:hypothetical protein
LRPSGGANGRNFDEIIRFLKLTAVSSNAGNTMLKESMLKRATCTKTIASTGRSYTVVRPGLALAVYYATPLHKMVEAVEAMIDAFLMQIPENSITAICGTTSWSKFSTAGLKRQLKRLQSKDVDYTNIDLGSGDLLASEGPYGLHVNGGNLANTLVRPNNTNVIYFEFPPDELSRVGSASMVEWVVGIVESHPFESAQFGFSFNQLQRTWTQEADSFVGNLAMSLQGFDVLEPALARVARGYLPNCSWLTILGEGLLEQLGGTQQLSKTFGPEIEQRLLKGGVLVQSGDSPAIGDVDGRSEDLRLIRVVAQATRPVRIVNRASNPVLLYGSESFRSNWLNRFDG